jgi:hypothetical protein
VHSAHSVTIFTANLTGANEVPPNASPATGFGLFTLNDAQTELAFQITYSGLTGGPISGAHFHNGPAGVNAPVVRGLDISAATSPDGSFMGVWSSTDMQPLTTFLVSELFAGRIYFNIHTNDTALPNFPGGEIRDQLIVPEPSTILLCAGALAAIALRRRWRAS